MKIVNCPPVGEAGKFKIAKHKGFTLIEILIVIAITGVLIATVVVNSGRNPDRDVRLEKDRLITFLRDIQNMTLSAEQLPDTSDFSDCYDTTDDPHKFICNICGFGIKKDSGGSVQVYYVKKTNLDDSCSTLTGEDGEDYTGKIFTPRNEVTIGGLETTDRIFFLIPSGKIYDAETPMSENKTITLSKTDGETAAVNVVITPGGTIKEE